MGAADGGGKWGQQFLPSEHFDAENLIFEAKMEADKIVVVGGGSWGTSLAALLAASGRSVSLLLRDSDLANEINSYHTNSRYLTGIALPESIKAFIEPEPALANCKIIVWAIPCQTSRAAIADIKPLLTGKEAIISSTKGIEEASLKRMEEVFAEELAGKMGGYAAISGPSFALEVAKKMPTAVVLASKDEFLCQKLQRVFSTAYFRAYGSADVVGVELAGAVKNVIAIAAGMAEGRGFGHNTRAALITRGLAEISRLGVAMGANPATFMGLSGMGDLVLTCTGDLSRNRHVGYRLGKGEPLKRIISEMSMVAEGVRTASAVKTLSSLMRVDMPVTRAVCAVVDGETSVNEATDALMARDLKME